jgi:putative transposase
MKPPGWGSFLRVALAGWIHRKQQDVIDCLREENRILREQLRGKRPRLTDAQRRRLAAKGKGLGRRLPCEIATRVAPETIPRWNRKLMSRNYDGSPNHGPGRPPTPEGILGERGLDPTPMRGKRTSWSPFLKSHREVMGSADFFSVKARGVRHSGLPT